METPHSLPPGLLAKVRALLAKAESTSYDAEAEAFTAKAQELMTRYRIDQALVDGEHPPGTGPTGLPFWIDRPYTDAKAALLTEVAEVNGCHAVWDKGRSTAIVFGFPAELEAVDELFTSLLVQAVIGMQREGSKADGLGRSRTARFRRSFLLAFAVRIGQRLRQTIEATVADAARETGTALVPLLAQRAEAARAAARAEFPRTRTVSPSASDPEGWVAGTRLADVIDLTTRRRISRRTA